MKDNFYQKIKNGEIELKVFIYTRPNFRSDSLEYELEMGRKYLENMFEYFNINNTVTDMFFSFPERWLNVAEQQQLFDRIENYYPNVERITIKTHAPLIITQVPNGFAFILDDPKAIDNKDGKLYFEDMVGNFFNAEKLNVIGGKINVQDD